MKTVISQDAFGNWRWAVKNHHGSTVAMCPRSFESADEARTNYRAFLRKSDTSKVIEKPRDK